MRHVAFTLTTAILVLTGQRRRAHWFAVRHWLRWLREFEHPIRCSWCQRGKRYGNPALPTSHTICHACRVTHFRDVPISRAAASAPRPVPVRVTPRRRVLTISAPADPRLLTDRREAS